ncbi:hypothetical protein EJD97_017962 [Solanum chilense]|uniref:Uncharacterized protein n=1 Tax=Solanum chilense TaxID=4083 RepID=A0A6N2B4Q9_SOLCI|nr:hypothetical protein EJD97_017962 [Solanum chilense]
MGSNMLIMSHGYQMPDPLSTDIEVYGMQGIPSDVLAAHYGEEVPRHHLSWYSQYPAVLVPPPALMVLPQPLFLVQNMRPPMPAAAPPTLVSPPGLSRPHLFLECAISALQLKQRAYLTQTWASMLLRPLVIRLQVFKSRIVMSLSILLKV